MCVSRIIIVSELWYRTWMSSVGRCMRSLNWFCSGLSEWVMVTGYCVSLGKNSSDLVSEVWMMTLCG